ncbi:DUF5677 domain-containing protein [Nitrososphaera viennensis]|uniref:Uncharacterized protein n=2 Tax=Nitrososphaera viennensis TaxID=1034015 RepID=A0A060HVV3_9ARCH|nr:DUF5677 domain-containing protein [Nitrososphaera viennensis]AIC17177.1 hypothetical protein NVIE_029010 [Nitrososphaera viennensis EN76]UVS69067.1 DUF5677 domain-containing protein [Nitrososphaera viennensis]
MEKEEPTVYTPDNEPYLGRETVLAFDNAIIACLNANKHIAPYTHKIVKSDLQWVACQIIPQGISIALSIRELVRQGYLFGASVLTRSLIERATIMLYLYKNPEKVEVWKRGWKYNERPKLAEMLNSIGKDKFPNIGRMLTPVYNSLTHGDPESALWNLVQTRDGGVGYSVSKILNNPSLCDKICFEGSTWLLVLTSMAITIFPKATD